MWYQTIRSPSFSFVTIHASNGRTDGRTELRQQYLALHYMQSHGKSCGLALMYCQAVPPRYVDMHGRLLNNFLTAVSNISCLVVSFIASFLTLSFGVMFSI